MNLKITEFYSNATVSDCPKSKQPEYAFIGRSNVGKSSLINMVLNHKIAYTSSKPGKTQLINHIVINNEWSLVDLPGYGYAKLSKAKKTEILNRTRNYFTNRGLQLAAAFVLIDIRIPPQKIDLEWMEWLVKNKVYFVRTFTKSDDLNKHKIMDHIAHYNKTMYNHHWEKLPETIITSSVQKIGQNKILTKITEINELFQNI